jgi:hypothetical protein
MPTAQLCLVATQPGYSRFRCKVRRLQRLAVPVEPPADSHYARTRKNGLELSVLGSAVCALDATDRLSQDP